MSMGIMKLEDAKKVFDAYIAFAERECAAAGGRENADAVAVFNKDSAGVSVVASAVDKVHKFTRGHDLKKANRVAHKRFTESIRGLFNVDKDDQLDPIVKDALKTLSGRDRPLTARRISIIAQAVNLVLAKSGDSRKASPVTAALDKLTTDVGQLLQNYVKEKPTVDRAQLMTGVMSSVRSAFSTVRSLLFTDVKDKDIVAYLDSVDTAIAGSQDCVQLLNALNLARNEFRGRLLHLLEKRGFRPGSVNHAVAYSALNLVDTLDRTLRKDIHLLGIRTVRENAAGLKAKFAGDSSVTGYLDSLLACCTDDRIAGLTPHDVGQLLGKSDPDYVTGLRARVVSAVQKAVDEAKAAMKKDCESRPVPKGGRLMSARAEDVFRAQKQQERLQGALAKVLAEGHAGQVDPGDMKEEFGKRQREFIANVEGQLSGQVKQAVEEEKTRHAAPPFEIPAKLEEEFVAYTVESLADAVWDRAEKGEDVRLDKTRIEDDFAKILALDIRRQVFARLEERLDGRFDGAVKAVLADLNPRLEEARKAVEKAYGPYRAVMKLDLEIATKQKEQSSLSLITQRTERRKKEAEIADCQAKKRELLGVPEGGAGIVDEKALLADLERRVADIQEQRCRLEGRYQAVEDLLRSERDRLHACAEHLMGSFDTIETVDAADLQKTLAAFDALVEESVQAVQGAAAGEVTEEEKRLPANPEAFRARPRFGVHDAEGFARHAVSSARGWMAGVVEDDRTLKPETRKRLAEAVNASLADMKGIPEHLLKMARAQCVGETDALVARTKVMDQLEAYLGCFIKGLAAGVLKLPQDGSLPSIDEAQVKKYVVEQEQSSYRGDYRGVTAFGNEARIDGACALLNKIDFEGRAELAARMDAMKALFARSESSAAAESDVFDRAYLARLNELLDAQEPNGTTSVRRHLESLLRGIVRVRDPKPEDVRQVGDCARAFVKIADRLVAEAERTAREKTIAAMPENVRPLVGYKGLRTLDVGKLVDAFKTDASLGEEEFRALAGDHVETMVPFVVAAGVKAPFFKKFYRGLASEAFPRGMLAKCEPRLVLDLVTQKQLSDEKGADPGARGALVKGFDTFDGKEILCALSTDGLLGVTYRDEDDAEHPSTAELLSLLWTVNGSRAGGLPQICQKIFGKDIPDVTKMEFKLTVAAMGENAFDGRDILEGVGVFTNYSVEELRDALDKSRRLEGLFSGGIDALFRKREGDPVPKLGDVMGWIGALRDLKKDGQSVEFQIDGVTTRVTRAAGGCMTVSPVGRPDFAKWIPRSPESLADGMVESVLRYSALYKEAGEKRDIAAMLPPATDPAARDLALLVIRERFAVDAVRLANIPTDKVRAIAEKTITGSGTKDDLEALLRSYSAPKTNAQAVLDLVARLDAAERNRGKDAVDALVKIPPVPQAAAAVPPGRVFAADVLADPETWKGDGTADAESRLKAALTVRGQDVAAFAAMSAADLREAFRCVNHPALADAMESLIGAIRTKAGGTVTMENVSAAIKALDAPDCDKVFEAVKTYMETLQDEFRHEFVANLASSRPDETDLMSLYELAGTDSIDLSNGYGALLAKVLGGYFAGIGAFDQSAILAAVLRDPASDSVRGRIAAMVKNAGPVFVKMMQGIPAGAVPPDLQRMMSDIKDSLPPIPERIVRAQLFDIVERSNGQIRGVEVVRSLGAASVGQALLCRVKTDVNPDGEECVVKLLRPGVQNFAERERQFIAGFGRDAAVFDGRLRSIFRELDLTEEARNVESGLVYKGIGGDSAMNRVGTMELHPLIRPSAMTLVARKAPGETCEKYFSHVEERLGKILASVTVSRRPDASEACYRNGPDGTAVSYEAPTYSTLTAVRDRLCRLYDETRRRQADLLALSYKWTEALLFPEGEGADGFMHGDLHTGNIMTEANGMTFIDFGNAMKISAEERRQILRLLVPCSVGNAGDFIGGLEKFGVTFKAFSGKKDALKRDLASAFSKGTMNDTGLRFAAAMSLLQKHGIEQPPVLAGFSQSMLRLQNAVERANTVMRRIEGAIGGVRSNYALRAVVPGAPMEDPFDPPEMAGIDTTDVKSEREALGEAFAAEYTRCNSDLGAAYEKRIKSICLDEEGRFQPQKVRDVLVPLLERHRDFYVIPSMNSPVPQEAECLGAVACRLAQELADSSFDLRNADPEIAGRARQQFDTAVAELAQKIESRVMQYTGNLSKTWSYLTSVTPPMTFSQKFEECMLKHRSACLGVYDLVRDGAMLLRGGYKGKMMTGIARGEEENARLNRIANVNQAFMKRHPGFPVDVVQKVTACVMSGFVYEEDAFPPGWTRTVQFRERPCQIIRANVQRLRRLLAQDGLDFGKDHDLWGARTAVELALDQFCGRYELDARMKEFTDEQLDALCAQVVPENGLDQVDCALIVHAMRYLHARVRPPEGAKPEGE